MSYPLHEEALVLVQEERQAFGRLIENLQKNYEQKLYLRMGYPSMFEYIRKGLGYAEDCAYRRVSAIRIVKEIPEIKDKLQSGALTLTTATMAQTLFNKEKFAPDMKRRVISEIENKSKRETEKILSQYTKAEIFRPAQKITQLAGHKVRLQLDLSQDLIEKFEKIKSLRSHVNPNMNYEELLNDMADFMLTKLDPQLKKEKSVRQNPASRRVSVQLKARVFKRDVSECQYVDPMTKKKCESTHLLELDHIKPFSLGGQTTFENLRLFCKGHNIGRNDG